MMMDVIINETFITDIEKESKLSKKKSAKEKTSAVTAVTKTKKQTREPKLKQDYKQSVNPSKRHRDRLNSELENLAKLLPFPEDVIARLDKLSILRLSVSFLRNKNFFKGLAENVKEAKNEKSTVNTDQYSSLFNEALDGFLMVITLHGEIFYISEKVKDYLGYSQSQVLHQPLETLVHDDDRDELVSHLTGGEFLPKVEEITDEDSEKDDPNLENHSCEFIIRLKTVLNTSSSDMYKPFKISGTIRKLHIEPETDNLKYGLFAFCTPVRTSYSMLEIRMKSTLFCSKNRIDLSFLDLDQRGKEFFGYSKKDIFGRSSYVLVHRSDVQHLRCKHTEIMTCGKTSLGTFRLMNKNNEWVWICGYGRVMFKNGKPDFMVTTNRIMSEEEGLAMLKLRDQSDLNALRQLGLIEPEDRTKAIELGFPQNSENALESYEAALADSSPIPMPLGAFLSLDAPPRFSEENNALMEKDNETSDLLKGAMFDVDVPERFLNCSADQIMNDPLSNLSPEDFQEDRKSSNASSCSEHTTRTFNSNHTNASGPFVSPQVERIDIQDFGAAAISPNNSNTRSPPQSQKSIFTELKPMNAVSSNASHISITQSMNTQQYVSTDSLPLIDDLSHFDFLQQHSQKNSDDSRNQVPMQYQYAPYQSHQVPDNHMFNRAPHTIGMDQISTGEYMRTPYVTTQNRMAQEQVGPNVTIGSTNFDLSSMLHAHMQVPNQRSNVLNTQRQFHHMHINPHSNDYTGWMKPPTQPFFPQHAVNNNPSTSMKHNNVTLDGHFVSPPRYNWTQL